MLIINPGTIAASHWYMLELRSERTSEETIKRIGKALKRSFLTEGAELFVPVITRDLDTFILLTECYIFVRADDVQKIAKLRQVTGVHGVVSKGESLNPSKFIKVEDVYVQELIQRCWDAHNARASAIRVGSWVRIIDGQTRNYCGLVVSIYGNRTMVKVDVKTKVLTIETSLHNLLDLSDVPEAHRVFYYSDPVKKFLEDYGPEAEAQLKQDLVYNETEARAFLLPASGLPTNPSQASPLEEVIQHISREQTPTRFVKSLVEGGERDTQTILTKTVAAIRAGTIRRPKNALILWHVIRGAIVKVLAPVPVEGKTVTYTKLLEGFGLSFRLFPSDVHAAMPELPFRPVNGQVTTFTPMETPTLPTLERVTPVIRAALESGNYTLGNVIRVIEERLRRGTIRAPKHLHSLAVVIRQQVLKHFELKHPHKHIRELAALYHEDLRLNSASLQARFPNLESLILTRRDIQVRKALNAEITISSAKEYLKLDAIRKKPSATLAGITVTGTLRGSHG